MSQFKKGDVIVLKSGGSNMTVTFASDECVNVVWHDINGVPYEENYHPELLTKRPEEAVGARIVSKPAVGGNRTF